MNRTLTLRTLTVAPLFAVLLAAVALGGRPEHAMTEQTPTKTAYSSSQFNISPLSQDEIDTLATGLTAEEARVILRSGTEPAFCGNLLDNKLDGTYTCRLCSLPLFASNAKFDSGSGWPSFFQPYDPQHIREVHDTSHGMVRTEIQCARCTGHLGHVFRDGPPPTGLRYCLNSVSLEFYSDNDLPERARPIETHAAYFAGGCFWGIEDRFQIVPGVLDAVSGYQGGHLADPSYKEVCYTDTGHAESVKVIYDPSVVSYETLLDEFFAMHNPTQRNGQGVNIGTQYRSAIFADNDAQFDAATKKIAELQESARYRGREIVTELNRSAPFWKAEEYHQDFHLKNGGSCAAP